MNKIGNLLLALIVAFAAITGGAAAAWDTETTNTTTVSDFDGVNDIVTLPADSTQEAVYLEVTTGTVDGVAYVYSDDNQDGVADSAELIHTDSSPTATDDVNGHYAFSLSGADLSDLEKQDGQILTNLIVEIDEDGDGVIDTSTVAAVDALNVSETHVRFSQAAANDSRVDINSEKKFFDLFGEEINVSSASADAAINGNATDVRLSLVDTDLANTVDVSSASAGDIAYGVTVLVDNKPVPVFVESAPSEFDTTSTYATVSGDEVSPELGDDYIDRNSVNVRVMGNDPLGILDAIGVYGVQDAFGVLSA